MNIGIFKTSAQEPPGIISQCHKQLNTIGKITLENVSKLSPQKQSFLRENSPARLKELALMNCYAADKIKKELDKKYGENNYVLIAVGRSVSSIAELLGEMGADTKIIPISGLRLYDIDKISQKNLKVYKSFLNKIGLSKFDLKYNSDKTYILTDYTKYGRTLEKTEKLLKSESMLDNPANLISVPISDLLGEDYVSKGYQALFEYCRFKDYSYVGKLFPYNFNKVFKVCSPGRNKELKRNITQGLRKLFWFNVFYTLKEKLSKNKQIEFVMPKNELKAIHNHFLSPEAYRNRLKADYNSLVCMKKTRK